MPNPSISIECIYVRQTSEFIRYYSICDEENWNFLALESQTSEHMKWVHLEYCASQQCIIHKSILMMDSTPINNKQPILLCVSNEFYDGNISDIWRIWVQLKWFEMYQFMNAMARIGTVLWRLVILMLKPTWIIHGPFESFALHTLHLFN